MPDTPPDADFLAMQRLADGDDLALNEIMERWGLQVASFLQRMTGDRDAAIDLAEETFVRLYLHRESYAPQAAFATYLFRIASNLARNHHRWRLRHPTVSLGEECSGIPEPVNPGPAPDIQVEQRDRLHQVETALAALPQDLRQAMLLFTYEDMSYAQVAKVMGCSVKAVETRIYRARQILKELLRDLES